MTDKTMSSAENTLHRYYAWASDLREQFRRERNANGTGPNSWMYMTLWFSLLNTVIEGWVELGLHDKEIDKLLERDDLRSLLRRYRNGAFHFQREYFGPKFAEMIAVPDSGPWCDNLTNAFGRYFAHRAIDTNHPALAGQDLAALKADLTRDK